MKERNITITIDKAREWYNSENDTLKKIALQAFSKNELKFNQIAGTKLKNNEFKSILPSERKYI